MRRTSAFDYTRSKEREFGITRPRRANAKATRNGGGNPHIFFFKEQKNYKAKSNQANGTQTKKKEIGIEW